MPTAARARSCLVEGCVGSSIANVVLADVPAIPDIPDGVKASNSSSSSGSSSSNSSSSNEAVANFMIDGWVCRACTFINAEPSNRCSICETSRPSVDASAPEITEGDRAELRMKRARAIITDLAGTYVRLPDRIVHGAALFYRLPAGTPASKAAAVAAAAAKPKEWVPQKRDRVRMTMDSHSHDLDWAGCPGTHLSFSVGYTVSCRMKYTYLKFNLLCRVVYLSSPNYSMFFPFPFS